MSVSIGDHIEAQCADTARALRGFRDRDTWRVPCPLAEEHPKKKGCGGLTLRVALRGDKVDVRCDFECDHTRITSWLTRRGFLGDESSVHHEPDAEATAIWQSCKPIRGTLGEGYLRAVGVHGEIPATLRYRLPGKVRLPMIAGIVQAPDRVPIALHLLLLDRARPRLVDPPTPQRLTVGALGRGAVRLAPASHGVLIVETIEEALLSNQAGRPAWASLGAWRTGRVDIPVQWKEAA